jgi:hypothetical protein
MGWMGTSDQPVNAKVPIGKIPRRERKSSLCLSPTPFVLIPNYVFIRFSCMPIPCALLYQCLILIIAFTARWGALLMAQAASRDFADIAVLRVFSGAL